MADTTPNAARKVLAVAAAAEGATGLALMVDPAIVVAFLLGVEIGGVAIALGRCFGIALLALALACWPGRQGATTASQVVLGMLTYNALVALYLAYLGVVRHMSGVLLWPVVLLHAVVALLLVWTRRNTRNQTKVRQ